MRPNNDTRGFTLIEMIATLALIAVVSLIAANELKELDDPLKNSTAELIGFFKQVRARAIATTSAYTVIPTSASHVKAVYSDRCSDQDTTDDPTLVVNFPNGAMLSSADWFVCFNSRGLPDANVVIDVVGSGYAEESRTIEVFLGGAVKEVET